MENEEGFWKLRKGKTRNPFAGRVVIGPNRRVTRSPRHRDPHFRLTCAERAKHVSSKWKGSLGETPEPMSSNCFVGPEMAQWLLEKIQLTVAT